MELHEFTISYRFYRRPEASLRYYSAMKFRLLRSSPEVKIYFKGLPFIFDVFKKPMEKFKPRYILTQEHRSKLSHQSQLPINVTLSANPWINILFTYPRSSGILSANWNMLIASFGTSSPDGESTILISWENDNIWTELRLGGTEAKNSSMATLNNSMIKVCVN